ncbi:MAG TPA: transketolase C-terminal domain-containing protein [Vitreimonas sp.]|nr:transketolase C-terminal domain-containing protein [Vitreimonas sp.]
MSQVASNLPTLGSIRDGFGIGLLEMAKKKPEIVALCADLTESVRLLPFKAKYPQRFIEIGVAEQNLVGVAAGLALAGKIPFAASYAAFSPGRSFDQLRVSVCYSNLNVKLIGGHAGLTVGPDGATHQMLEDLALTRSLPNLTVVVPCDQEEARKATHAIAKHLGPCYLRLSRDKSPVVTKTETPFSLGKAVVLQPGKHVTLFACGIMVAEALQAAEHLKKHDVVAEVINIHTLKPLDKYAIVKSAQKTRAVVTAEEHQLAGGLGSAISEVLAESCPTPLERVGIRDQFGESGESQELLAKFELTSNDIIKAVWKVLERKQER